MQALKICIKIFLFRPPRGPFFFKNKVNHFAPEMGQSGSFEVFLKNGVPGAQ